jgi:hypothetical protein
VALAVETSTKVIWLSRPRRLDPESDLWVHGVATDASSELIQTWLAIDRAEGEREPAADDA